MAHGWFFLLLTLGVCGLSSYEPRQFHVVKEEKNWVAAQQYCRREFTDLATIDNITELEKAKRVMKNANVTDDKSAWIGLKYGGSPKWKWSLADEGFYGENEAEFQNWNTDAGQAHGNAGKDCGSIRKSTGKWHDRDCTETRRFICYNKKNSAQPYVLVEEGKNWADAQRYCRDEYTDLARVRNQTENKLIKDLITGGGNSYPWIGLFWFDGWEWSDGSSSSFRHWTPGEPNLGATNTENTFCARMKSSGLWNDVGEQHDDAYFICYEAVPTVEVVSPQSPFYPGEKVTLSCDIPKYTGQHQYVWLKDNSPVPGETSQTINITLPGDAGQYQCHRHREGSSVAPYISLPVTITFNDLPTATVEVVSPQTPFYSGDDVTLSCDIPEYSDWHQYVWLKDNSPIPGETSQTITITLPLKAGRYQCSGERSDRPETSSVSNSVNIIINALPTATVEVVSPQTPFYSGDEVTLRCDIAEYSDWHQYVWLKDSTQVPGKTSETITIILPLEAVQYQCSGERQDRPETSSVSNSVDIISNALPAATVEVVSPQSPFYSGDEVTLRCDIPEYSDWHQYVWLKDSSPVPGETSETITITLPLEDQYQCSGKRPDRPETSSVSSSVDIISNDLPDATVEVVSPQSPFYSGDVVTLKCNVTNYTGQHLYVWLKDSTPVPDQTSLTINITLPEDVGQYQCYRQRGNLLNTSSVSSSVPVLNNDKLVLVKEQKTWKEALEYCRQHHEDLVSVSSEQIQRWVEGWAKGASTPNVWVGLRYSCNLGFWFWVSGEIICYDNWTSDQERDQGCSYKVGAVRKDGGKWGSFKETDTLNFICTKEGQWN